MAYDEEKGKSCKDALRELVKCKTSKTIFQPIFPEMPDISGL
jgi:hypothetical protein